MPVDKVCEQCGVILSEGRVPVDKVCEQCEVILSEGRVPVDKVCEQCEMICQKAMCLWTKSVNNAWSLCRCKRGS